MLTARKSTVKIPVLLNFIYRVNVTPITHQAIS